MLLHYLGKPKFEIIKYYHRCNLRIVSCVTEYKTFHGIWLSRCSYCHSSCLHVHNLPACMVKDGPATHQLHFQWCCCQCHAKRSAITAYVRHYCAWATRWLLDGTPYLVVDQIEVKAVRWLQIWSNDCGFVCSRGTVSHALFAERF